MEVWTVPKQGKVGVSGRQSPHMDMTHVFSGPRNAAFKGMPEWGVNLRNTTRWNRTRKVVVYSTRKHSSRISWPNYGIAFHGVSVLDLLFSRCVSQSRPSHWSEAIQWLRVWPLLGKFKGIQWLTQISFLCGIGSIYIEFGNWIMRKCIPFMIWKLFLIWFGNLCRSLIHVW